MEFQGVLDRFTRLRGEMVGIAFQPLGSRIRGPAGNGAGAHDSAVKYRGTDPQHGQIAATPTGQTPLVATPGAMLVGILMVIACTPTA